MSKKFSSMGLIKSERGNFAILFAVTLMVLISVMAFGLDIGFFARTKSKYQACADAAALSGAEKLCYARAEESAKTVVLGSNVMLPEDSVTIEFGFYDSYDEYDNFQIFQDFVQEDDGDFPVDEAINAVIVIIENRVPSLTGFNKKKNIKAAAVAYIPRVSVVAGKNFTVTSPRVHPMTINNGNVYAKGEIKLNGPVLGKNVKLASKNDIIVKEENNVPGTPFIFVGNRPSDKLPEMEIIKRYILPDPKATMEEYIKKMKKLADVVYTPDDGGTDSFYGIVYSMHGGSIERKCYFDFSRDHEDHQIIFFDTTGIEHNISAFITPHACADQALFMGNEWQRPASDCMRQIGITEAKGKSMRNTTFIATCPVNIPCYHISSDPVPLGGPGFDNLNIVSTGSISVEIGNNPLRGVNFYCKSIVFPHDSIVHKYPEQETDRHIRVIATEKVEIRSWYKRGEVRLDFKFGPPFAPMVPVTLGRLIETQITPDE